MPDRKCPIDLIQALTVKLDPMTPNDLEGFAGILGKGYIGFYPDPELIIVIDDGPYGNPLIVIDPHTGQEWMWDLPITPETQIV